MPITTFQGFLATANLHHGLLVDLCAEAGVIGRAKLLAYMERHGVAPMDKEALIQRYRRAAILYEETEDTYTVNPVVAGLVNFYERRGRLTHAEFLKDQIVDIGNLTDALQQALFADPPEPERIADTVDKLYLVVRQVRENCSPGKSQKPLLIVKAKTAGRSFNSWRSTTPGWNRKLWNCRFRFERQFVFK